MNKECSVLSPVGSMDVLEASVFSGADCVYLSGKKYGARDFADNFSYDDLKIAIDFCHGNNVKIFITVNTSILENEMLDVVDYIYFLYSHGVDGVIIQDVGLSYIVHKLMPDLELHASTQMTIYDYSFVKWLSVNGFSNANLSREVPLNRIGNIIKKSKEFNHDINIEVFVHGALCYCYSGQCLMSSFLGGRSGNRGLCAQPCRMRYALEDKHHSRLSSSNYLLSTRDLCTYHNVLDFVKAGVGCIKIEGRMKQKEYVASTTYSYKQAAKGIVNDENYLLLNLSFNRGLTGGYINQMDNVVGRECSGNHGYPIGKVIRANNNEVTIKFGNRRFPTKIVRGDGIKFEYGNETCGMYVGKIMSQSKNKITILLDKKINVKKDAMVYITYSKYLHDKTKEIINKNNVDKIKLNLEINMNNKLCLEVNCRLENIEKTISASSKKPLQKARSKPLTKETINKQLVKTGNTRFKIENIEYKNFIDDLFLPLSQLNEIRRELLEKIDKIINDSYMPSKNELEIVKNNIKEFKTKHYQKYEPANKNKSWNIYISSIKQAYIANKYGFIDTVYFDGSFNYNSIEDYAMEITNDIIELNDITKDKEIVLILPQLLLDNDIARINEIIVKLDLLNIHIKIQTDNIGVADNIITECYANNLNIYNNYSIEKLAKTPQFKRVCVSNELSYGDIGLLHSNDCQLEYIVFGNVQLMLSEDNFETLIKEDKNNPYYLVDKRNNEFKLLFDCYDHSHIFDYRILNLADELEKINNTNIDSLSIDLRFFNINDTQNTLEYFKDRLNSKKTELKLSRTSEFYKCNFKKGVYKTN